MTLANSGTFPNGESLSIQYSKWNWLVTPSPCWLVVKKCSIVTGYETVFLRLLRIDQQKSGQCGTDEIICACAWNDGGWWRERDNFALKRAVSPWTLIYCARPLCRPYVSGSLRHTDTLGRSCYFLKVVSKDFFLCFRSGKYEITRIARTAFSHESDHTWNVYWSHPSRWLLLYCEIWLKHGIFDPQKKRFSRSPVAGHKFSKLRNLVTLRYLSEHEFFLSSQLRYSEAWMENLLQRFSVFLASRIRGLFKS